MSRFGFNKDSSINAVATPRKDEKAGSSFGMQSKQPLSSVTTSFNGGSQFSSARMTNSFMDRKVRVGSTFNWTYTESENVTNEGAKYILLSSSPTRPESDKESNHQPHKMQTQKESRTSLHTTTMDQLSNRQTHAKKVYRLGATRRVNG